MVEYNTIGSDTALLTLFALLSTWMCMPTWYFYCNKNYIIHKQASPPAWTQEAYRPPRSKYMLCCCSWGNPPPRPDMGPGWGGYPHSADGGYPHPDLGRGYPYPDLGPGLGGGASWTWDGVPPPSWIWDGGIPLSWTWDGGTPSHPGPEVGYPPLPPVLTWDGYSVTATDPQNSEQKLRLRGDTNLDINYGAMAGSLMCENTKMKILASLRHFVVVMYFVIGYWFFLIGDAFFWLCKLLKHELGSV